MAKLSLKPRLKWLGKRQNSPQTQPSPRWLVAISGSIMLTILGSGCTGSDAPPTARVQGTVTMNGKPVANIGVVFFPVGPGPLASGNTDDSGQFELTTVSPKDGAVIGQHRVAFGAAEESESEYARKVLPARYESPQTSEITAEVIAGEVNKFSFELTR